jgi:hypothetical protein
MQVKKKTKTNSNFSHFQGQLLAAASRQSVKFKLSLTRALDSCPNLDASQKKTKKNSNFSHSQG